MYGITKVESNKIANMSFVCAMLVVAIHVPWAHDKVSASWYVYQVITEGFARIAVPFFFVVSGFFLGGHFDDEGWYCREVNKRLSSLVRPFYIWSLLSLVVSLFLSIVADVMAHRPFGTSSVLTNNDWCRILGLDFTTTPIPNEPLWYMRNLFLFVLAAPFLKGCVEQGKSWWVLLLFVLSLIHAAFKEAGCSSFWIRFFTHGFAISGLLYFSIGIYLSRINRFQTRSLYAIICTLAGCVVLGWKVAFLCYGREIPLSMTSISIPFLLYATWHFIPSSNRFLTISACSFPLYVMHWIMISLFGICARPLGLPSLVCNMVQFLGSIILSVFIVQLLRAKFPFAMRLLFADRGNLKE